MTSPPRTPFRVASQAAVRCPFFKSVTNSLNVRASPRYQKRHDRAACGLRLGLPGRPRTPRQEIRPPRLLPRGIEGFLPMPGEPRGLLAGAILQKLAHRRLTLQRSAQQPARSRRVIDLAQPILQLLLARAYATYQTDET